MRVLTVLAAASPCQAAFSVVDGVNAVPDGDRTKQDTVDACQATCSGPCLQFSWSHKTHHCYTSPSAVWSPTANDRIESGCVAGKVAGCPGAGPTPVPPLPPPPPVPVPTPAGGRPPFGTAWFRSDAAKVNISYPIDPARGEVLHWDNPKKPTVLLTYLPQATELKKTGDEFRMKVGWRSDGRNKCDPFDWEDGKTCSCGQKLKETCEAGKGTPTCARTSVNCIEGTGDFRIGLWDTKSNSAPHQGEDDFAPGASGDDLHAYLDGHFGKYRGYHFRTMPHVSTKYYHPKASEPGGFYVKQDSTDPFDDHRLPTNSLGQKGVFAGFGAPNGQWSYLELAIRRSGGKTYDISIEMAGQRYAYTHEWDSKYADDMPQYVDAFGFWFPNSRSYDYVELSAEPSGRGSG